MFTIEEREIIKDKIVDYFSKDKNVLAVCLVGSNATGDSDEYSDLDISIIVEDEHIKTIWQKFYDDIALNEQIFRYFKLQFNKNSYLVSIFLNNGLEIDIGFTGVEGFIEKNTSKPNLKYLEAYKKSNFVIPSTNNLLRYDGMKDLEKANSNIWYNFKNAMFALKRNKLFRCAKEIEECRNDIINIITSLNNLESKHFKEVDKLTEENKHKIETTYPKRISYYSLKDALLSTMNLFFEILRNNGFVKEASEYYNLFSKLLHDIKLWRHNMSDKRLYAVNS